MLLVSANVNGIRAAARRGGIDWLAASAPDVVTLQEVRADDEQLRAELRGSVFEDWHVAHAPSVEKGRAGVAVLSRVEPVAVRDVLTDEFAGTGRWVEADLPLDGRVVTVASAYVHTGEARTPRQEEKQRFLTAMGDRLGQWAADGRLAVLTGDLNIAHTVDDLKNWKGNRGKSGFLPEEQAHLDGWGDTHGFVDVHRVLHGEGPVRTRGGRGAGRPSTTTRGGGSTTRSPRHPWRSPRPAPRSAGPPRTPSGGATTPPSRSSTP